MLNAQNNFIKTDCGELESEVRRILRGGGSVAAVDLGTTFISAAIMRGDSIKKVSCANPQRRWGADVISRISAAQSGNADALQRAATEAVTKLTSGCSLRVIAGNTVMLHLYAGKNTAGLGTAPYTTAYSGTLRSDGSVLLPCASAFIGADATAGFASLSPAFGDMLIDVGTNTEIMLCGDKTYAVSAASGPALEGIKAGRGAVAGAYASGGRVHAICDGEPIGFAASGMLETVAALCELGEIDKDGRLKSGAYEVCGLTLSQQRLTAFLTAKSAVRAGIESLMRRGEVRRVYLSGAMGTAVSVNAAAAIGLLPPTLAALCQKKSDTALSGAIACCTQRDFLQRVQRLCDNTVTVINADDPNFARDFIRFMGAKPE